MGRVALLVGLVAVVAAAAAGARPPAQPVFSFGRIGGNIRPFTVSIQQDGSVATSGPVDLSNPAVQVSPARRFALLALARRNGFWSLPRRTICLDSLPDVASLFVTIHSAGKTLTVAVRGECNGRFTRIYRALAAAATLRQ